ncbi:MAG: Holliday junction branch migration protein RuvA [bacterium]
MIASLRGTIQAKGDRFLIVETGDVGYQVYAIATLIASAKKGESIRLFTHHHVAENAQDLFGFLEEKEVTFFELLLSISSVGPKTALNVMSVATIDELQSAIQHGDPTLLTKVSGVGRKTAERIVLELKEKVDLAAGEEGSGALREDAEVLDALVALGYPRSEARQALRNVSKEVRGTSDRVRASLKHLGSHGR